MTPLDTSIIFIYMGLLIALGLYASRRQKGVDDYFLAGRRQNTFSIACLWLASWVGGAVVIGTSTRAYEIGISASWYVIAMGIGLFSFGLFFAYRVKQIGDKHQYLTYPEFIADRFDNRTQVVATLTTALAFIGFAAGQLVAAASIIQVLLGWDYGHALLLASAIVIIYTATGGYLAVTYTDWVQFLLLLLGVVIIGMPLAIKNAGGWGTLQAALPGSFFDMGSWGWGTILALIVSMGMSFFVAMDSFTRCFAARSAKASRNGAMLAVLFIVPITIAATWLGLASAVLFPGVENSNQILTTFVVELFPAGFRGLVLVGILAAVMSTADICILTASANVTRDVYHRYVNPDLSHRRMLRLGMLASAGAGIAAVALAWGMQDIIDVLLLAFTVNGAALFLPTMIAMYRGKGDPTAGFWSIALSLVTVVAWKIMAEAGAGGLSGIEPLWPGLAVSCVTYVLMSRVSGGGRKPLPFPGGGPR